MSQHQKPLKIASPCVKTRLPTRTREHANVSLSLRPCPHIRRVLVRHRAARQASAGELYSSMALRPRDDALHATPLWFGRGRITLFTLGYFPTFFFFSRPRPRLRSAVSLCRPLLLSCTTIIASFPFDQMQSFCYRPVV